MVKNKLHYAAHGHTAAEVIYERADTSKPFMDLRIIMSPKKWIEARNAIGIVSKAGRYGVTYAQSDIAMSFATWISPELQLYIMKDYRRLKTDENSRLSLNWNLNR